jgi:hypothetical protein
MKWLGLSVLVSILPGLKYDSQDLLNTLTADLEEITISYPTATDVITVDLNSLNTDYLVCDCGFSRINDAVTHGNCILDKYLVSRPDVYVCRTLLSSVKAKHKALLISGLNMSLPRSETLSKLHRSCYDRL